MSTPNDGGAAFPIVSDDLCATGMTLRDYFAAAALTGLIADATNYSSIPMNADTAYRHADAMLAERAKTKEDQS